MRIEKKFKIESLKNIKKKALFWANSLQTEMIWLDSNQYPDKYRRFEAVLAFYPHKILKKYESKGAFDALKSFVDVTNDYIFGYLSYDLKNDVEDLQSSNYDGLQFPELYFFQPEKIIFFREDSLIFSYLENVSQEIDDDFQQVCNFLAISTSKKVAFSQKNPVSARISKENYVKQVGKMQKHIARGDIYEANFCQEFYIENIEIEPLAVYENLNDISAPPFAVFLKFDEKYVLSASPERYLRRKENVVVSQPIKGTARRSDNQEEDKKLCLELEQNPKERSENVMIVDLVRNDLSLYAEKGSVKVTELCKPYTFKQVHQLISTIEVKLKEGTHSVDVIRSTFPMGSMTGAPKISAMQIIENLEATKRGVYSGAVGYFTPNADFDFNVVIRSILYNSENEYLSFSVGSAITAEAIAEKEYEECLVKANAMRKVLE
ncbi:anthranilate synthase component I family protein [Capnocytophaga felis]|uniref:Para-aminobenzoate synthase n=1 Tax=Capnocytophaga felis TaxID=2267611 RepID=A0A5M4B700_9FLAO|nr:anthranilate synthase component I family protein [Capnocytophaga felis]GET45055.1 para-aminobenzoate synthase [Capnocytophaga felis]GET47781.1 para-aminobenzoate synthase [Capnocytophaga felis]